MTSYFDLAKLGLMSLADAAEAQHMRECARRTMDSVLPPVAKPKNEGWAFGTLDGVSARLVDWFGPVVAAEVLRNYANDCERKKTGEAA